jgi:hypothetical protein
MKASKVLPRPAKESGGSRKAGTETKRAPSNQLASLLISHQQLVAEKILQGTNTMPVRKDFRLVASRAS